MADNWAGRDKIAGEAVSFPRDGSAIPYRGKARHAPILTF